MMCRVDSIDLPKPKPETGGSVLIIEDEDLAILGVRRELSEKGLDVRVAKSKEDAVVAASGSDFVAIILDLMIPAGENPDVVAPEQEQPGWRHGVDLLEMVRKGLFEGQGGAKRDVPVIVVSAVSLDGEVVRILTTLSVDSVITKPAHPAVIAETVAAHLQD